MAIVASAVSTAAATSSTTSITTSTASISISTAITTSAAAIATSSESTSTVSSTASSTTSASSGIVDLNLFPIDHFSVQLFDGLVGSIVVGHGYECVALFSVVDISNFATCAKFAF